MQVKINQLIYAASTFVSATVVTWQDRETNIHRIGQWAVSISKWHCPSCYPKKWNWKGQNIIHTIRDKYLAFIVFTWITEYVRSTECGPSLGFSFSYDYFTTFCPGWTSYRHFGQTSAVAACPHVLLDATAQDPHQYLHLIWHRHHWQ